MEEFTADSHDELFVSPMSDGEMAPETGSIAAAPAPVDGQRSNTLNNVDSPSAVFESIEGSQSLDVPSVGQTVGGFGHGVGSTIQKEPSEPSPASETPYAMPLNFEIVLPPLTREARTQYQEVQSDLVDFVIERVHDHSSRESLFRLEFTDGRQDLLSLSELWLHPGGRAALNRFEAGVRSGYPHKEMLKRPRRRSWVDQESSEDGSDDAMDLDEDDHPASRRRGLRASTRASARPKSLALSGDEEDIDDTEDSPRLPRRQLRVRPPRQAALASLAFLNGREHGDDEDELAQDSLGLQSDDDDNFQLVLSDLGPKPSRSRKPAKRLKLQPSRPPPSSRGSSIEFEDSRRRSGRSTRNTKNMMDEAMMDDDSFYVEDNKAPAAPKIMSVREAFQPLPPDSDFPDFHMDSCDVCNQGPVSNKGQLIACQGCSLAFHKACIGYRAQREHRATKIGPENFVLQCKWCIGMYKKRDSKAPRHDICQSCKGQGHSCAEFSEKKTNKQEEKMRQENDGEDPVFPVQSGLVNNASHVLFRCTGCKRAWHFEHLHSSQTQSDVSDAQQLRDQRLMEYSVNWRCEDCDRYPDKIQILVAWRPLKDLVGAERDGGDLAEDDKEYLVKWQDRSYFRCSWVPGAWIFGIAPAAMRINFVKRDQAQQLMKLTEKDAIPDEYLMADVILQAKTEQNTKAKTKEAELARITSVKKIYVKFQGLGYDEAVWDSPPPVDSGPLYEAFAAAYEEYLNGKYFVTDQASKMKQRVQEYRDEPFRDLKPPHPLGIKRGKLMEYQREGVNWLLYNYHQAKSVVLADEMGLGKTVQVVALMSSLIQDSPKCWPFLVVVPNSTCPNWRREIKFWAPDLRVVTYHGGKRPQELAYKYELFPDGTSEMKAHVVVMSYDSAQDEQTKRLFRSVNWAGLVVDEGQRLKNDQNLLYAALRSMRIQFRLLLTGTPLQNNKRELFNLIQFIDPTQNAAKLDEEYEVLNIANLPELHEKIRPYFLRRTKNAVLKFLPPMAQIILPVSMSVLQEKLCKSIMAKSPELIKAIFADSKLTKRQDRGSLNNILVQLRKCLCHPFIYSDAIEERSLDAEATHRNLVSASAKLLLLEQMLPKLKERGHRVLIFSQFLNQLDILEDFLNNMGYEHRRLDGCMGSLEKQRRIDAFNAPDSSVFAFLLSTRAGGVGINLATADTVIILDPDFNPHQDIQALSRAHRIGQKKKVLCFQLMTKNTVEEKIMQIGRKKMALDHVLIESMDKEDEAPDDLESILKFGASALFNEEQDEKDIIRYDDASIEKLLDRSELEQPKSSDDGTAETQFSFAKVWANDKGSLDDDLAEHEDPTLNPSAWEDILREREAEARRIAELNQVVLGRGGRRRQAVNYRSSGAADAADAGNASGSEVDGDFKADSEDDVDEDEDEDDQYKSGAGGADGDADLMTRDTKKGKDKKLNYSPTATPLSTPKKQPQRNNKSVDKKKPQTTPQPERTPTKSKAKSSPARKPRTPSKAPRASNSTRTPKENRAKLSSSATTPSSATAGGRSQRTSPVKYSRSITPSPPNNANNHKHQTE